MKTKLFHLFLATLIGNLSYQWLAWQFLSEEFNLLYALDRTYYQGVTLFIVYLTFREGSNNDN